jgi:excisionase family DNA binding protein
MESFEEIRRPSKSEQKVAIKSYNALASIIEQLHSDKTEIEIEETNDKIIIPVHALKLLGMILKSMSQGKPISIVPIATEVTTQKAAEILGCSRPFLIKLLEEGKIEFTKIGRHRRIMFEDVLAYKKKMKEVQKKNIIDIMNFDEELGLYDS